MEWTLKVIDFFSAAHFLRNYRGKCENLHGHNWKVELEVKGNRLNEAGFVMDFKELKRILKEIVEELDHKLLNEKPPFNRINPSSENIAKYIFDMDKEQLPPHVRISSVTVWESETSCASYSES